MPRHGKISGKTWRTGDWYDVGTDEAEHKRPRDDQRGVPDDEPARIRHRDERESRWGRQDPHPMAKARVDLSRGGSHSITVSRNQLMKTTKAARLCQIARKLRRPALKYARFCGWRGGGGATAGGGVRLYDPHLLIAGPDAAPDGEEVERGDPAVVLRVRARLKYGDAQGRQVPQVPPCDPRGPLRSACAS